jgi:orotidine-5'-phosphate decarboxylase
MLMEDVEISERLIFALDMGEEDKAKKMVEELDGLVSFFKVGIQLQLGTGLRFVDWLIGNGKKVFLDLKYYDVPETVKRAVGEVAKTGVSFLTIHGDGSIIRGAVAGRGEARLKLLAVTVLTSLDAAGLKEQGYHCPVDDLVLYRAKMASESGCDGVIASGREIAAIRREVGRQLLIVTPGIRPAGFGVDDHQRSVTPGQAIKAGADYIVVGRPIRDAADPRAAAEEIIREMAIAEGQY